MKRIGFLYIQAEGGFLYIQAEGNYLWEMLE